MTFFGYVDRQKELIRNRHSGEEIISMRGKTEIVREGEGAFRRSENIISDVALRSAEFKSSEQIFRELNAMKGLNRRERERFFKAADAV